MNAKTIANGILRAVGILILISLILLFVYKVRSIIAYILIAVVVSLIGRPLILLLRRKLRFNNTVAVVITMVLMSAVFVGLISLFIPLIIEQGKNLSLLNIKNLQLNLRDLYEQVADYFQINRYQVERSVEESLRRSDLVSRFNFSMITDLLNPIMSGLGSFGFGFFTVIFIAFFFMRDSKLFQNTLLLFIPDSEKQKVVNSIDKIKNLLSRYFIGLLIQITILFFWYTVILLTFGIEDAFVIAFLCALLNLIPYIGPIIGGVLMVILTMSSNLGEDFSTVIFPKAIYVFIGFVAGQLIDNFFSQPYIFSSSVKSHPLEIFLVIIVAGVLFGVTGMVLAIPAYTALKVILKEFLSENEIVRSITKDL
ncbi:AI-2E family transporter [Robertkochia aurantiaca]|uniref:AI-2E family transporter n=1 Tax=Robertkochia aurantiaca TaxID=2873700 RepID=UPI001CCA5284|nr:AI-2E family transporter [Robertkochia sp. 3YJGBD-33]